MKILAVFIFVLGAFCHARAASARDIILAYQESRKIPRLALDTNKFHASSRFAFRAKIIISEAAVSDLVSTSSEIAVSVADKAVCLVTTTNGLPFSYMTENFWVSFSDRSLPGTLVYMAVGNPQFVLANSETNEFKIDFHFGFDAAFDRPNIAINLAGLFDPSFSAQPPAYDEKTRELAFVSKTGAKVFLMMSQRESDPFGIDAIRLERKAKLMIDSIQSQVAANTLPVLATEKGSKRGHWCPN